MIQLNFPIFVSIEYSKSFTEEYPICSKLKNILVPYPKHDMELFSDQASFEANFVSSRPHLLFYKGGAQSQCIHLKKALSRLINTNRSEEEGYTSSVFCPVPFGDTPSSRKMYEILNVSGLLLLLFLSGCLHSGMG